MSKRITVFLVDDDVDDQEIFSLAMKEASQHVDCLFANDGVQALRKLKDPDFSPDIIFLDINMPKMNGLELLTELNRRPPLAADIFMYSTTDEKEIVGQCIELGASGFIKKHIDTDELREEFKKIIEPVLATKP
jgi:CheY-like chemotaxis protein